MYTEKKHLFKRPFNIKIWAIIGILGLVISYFAFSSESPKKFSDVKEDNWAYDEINFLTKKNIIAGYPDGTFKPNQSIIRLQSVMMILREKGIDVNSENIVDPGFIDVKPGDYGYEVIAKSAELGIIDGKVNDKGQKYFDPNGTLTRSQMAKILTNAYNLEGNGNMNYSDVPKDHWAYSSIQALAKNGIAYGYGNGNFGANDSLTRAQFAGMMARILDKSFVVSPPPSKPQKQTQPSQSNSGGKVYPDGWVAPVLKSSWSPNHATNLKTLQNELGFSDRGRTYSVTGRHDAIQVIQEASSKEYEVDLLFYMWESRRIPESYRIPIVAKELFKLYFEEDATKVWTYLDNAEIPDHFTANGRKVDVIINNNEGSLLLQVGRK